MGKDYLRLLLLVMTMVSYVTCKCPRESIQSTGNCSFRIHCHRTVNGVSFPDQCRGSTNYPVTIDLTLTEAIEPSENDIWDLDFLRSITTLRVSAKWPKTDLSFLKLMPFIKNLFLVDDQIRRIDGEPFFELNSLENLDLSHNRLTDIEDLFQFENQPNELKKLSLAHNTIEEIPGDVFAELTSLVELDLSYNFISDLNEEPFSNLTSLVTLRLNNNRIKDLNGAVNNLEKLEHLYLRGNKIQNIDDKSLQIIFHLKTFDVSENQLDKLKPIIFLRHWQHFGGVCKIILSENRITSIPNGTAEEISTRFTRQVKDYDVGVLTKLDLSKNAIDKVEYNAFRSIVHLMSLDLSFNRLEDLYVDPADVSNVRNLNLSHNYISNLYFVTFLSMDNLRELDLSHNRLKHILAETFIYNFNEINLNNNKIDSWPFKMFNSEGGVLDLTNNGLVKLYIPFNEGLHLKTVILRCNQITDAVFINLLFQNQLKSLDLSDNNIKKLNASSLRLPLSLITLDLSNNSIQEIGPASFHRVSLLKFLNLSFNKLKSIEYGAFQGLTSLTDLDLSHNYFEYLDSKVLMDLKSLSTLSLRFNGLKHLNYDSWLGRKHDLKVELDGNKFTCDWLSKALNDANNGYSKMRPVAQTKVLSARSTLEGIQCVDDTKDVIKPSRLIREEPVVLADERLLVISQKIFEAVQEQTYYLRAFMHRFNVNFNNYESMSRLIKRG